MTLMSLRAALSAVVLAGCTAALTGCGISSETALSSSQETGAVHPFGGSAFGGQQPISGAHVYVYATGTSAYGGSSTSLLNAGSAANGTTYGQDSNGNYYLVTDGSGNYYNNTVTCSAGTQAYVYIIGGNPGAGTNSAAGLMAPLGPCVSGVVNPPNNVTFVNANEITTIVAAYALAGYATSPTKISSGGSTLAATGLTNASNTALNIVDIQSGFIPSSTTTVGGATIPVAEIYTLANALSSCVNSTGPSSTSCTKLLGDTGTTDTASAAIVIAHTPFANTNDLFTLGTQGTPVFSPTLGTAPTDFTLALQYKTAQYNANQMSGANSTSFVDNWSLAIDPAGNVWTRGTNDGGSSPLNNTTTFAGYTPLGGVAVAPVSVNNNSAYNSLFNENPFVQLGIDKSGNVWSGMPGGAVELSSSGSVTTIGCNVASVLTSTVFGSNSHAYAAEYGGSGVLDLSAGCAATTLSGAPSGFKFLGYLATDTSGDILASGATSGNTSLYKFTPGTTTATLAYNTGADYITEDSSNDTWAFSAIGGTNNTSLYKYSSGGNNLSNGTDYYQGGLEAGTSNNKAGYQGVHLDGASSAWISITPCASGCNDLIAGVTSTGAGIPTSYNASTKAYTSGLTLPYNETGAHALAPDGSGNLWVALKDGSLMQFVGLATPVATPILYNQLASKP